MADDTIVREVKVRATPETIFPFFTDPVQMIRWKGTHAELDAQPGGVYRVTVGGKYVARGKYVEIDPPRRVVFTWGWEGEHPVRPGSTTVEIDLEPDGDYTLVRLTHRGLAIPGQAEEHTKRWDHYLSRLDAAASGGDPGPDTMPGA